MSEGISRDDATPSNVSPITQASDRADEALAAEAPHPTPTGSHFDDRSRDFAVTMDDLIDAYHIPGRPTFRAALRHFERHNGSVKDSFIAHHIHAGALLVSPLGVLPRLLRHRKIRIRYDGGEAAVVQPAFEAAIWRARSMERESALLLGGRSRKALIEMLYTIIVYLLGVLDAMQPKTAGFDKAAELRMQAAIDLAESELQRLELFTRTSAKRLSLRWYLLGLPIGAVAGLLLIGLADTLEPFGVDSAPVVICLGSGGIGAIMSVMIRITRGQHLEVDIEQGTAITLLAGGFRPLIGAIFGVALYVLVAGDFVPLAVPTDGANIFYAGLAFLSGFSERWAQDTIVRSTPKVGLPSTEPAA